MKEGYEPIPEPFGLKVEAASCRLLDAAGSRIYGFWDKLYGCWPKHLVDFRRGQSGLQGLDCEEKP